MIQDVCLVFWRFAILIYFVVGEVQDPWHHHLGLDRSTLTLIELLRSILELWSWTAPDARAGNTRGKRSHQYPGSNIQQLILASPGAVEQ